MKKRIPVLPIPLDKAMKVANNLLNIGDALSNMFPSLDFELEQSGYDYEPREWVALGVFSGLFYFSMMFGAMSVITMAAKIALVRAIGLSFAVGFAIAMMSFFYIVFYPKLQINKKVKDLEGNLPYALQHLLIEIRSGVPLFNSMDSIAKSNYGVLSVEIQKAVNEINTGKSEIAALEKLARLNPSLYFRRVMWQIVNALKSGADIGATVEQIVISLSSDQVISIKKYGATLNPLALMYMIFAVIFPTLGITFILVISSFLGLGISLELVLLGILLFIFFFQFMMIGLIKTRRPVGV
jgi:flagellar protein FlaJ